MKWTRKARAPVERTLPILRRLLSEGYDTAIFEATSGKCALCRSLDGREKTLEDLISDTEYDAPIYSWSHVNCRCTIRVTGSGLEDVILDYSGVV